MKKIILIVAILSTSVGLFSQPTLQWAKTYNGIGTFQNDISSDMVTDQFGNVIVTGASYDTSGTGNSDIITIKYDPNGNVIWSKVLSLGSGDSPYKIGIDNNNDIIIVGYTYSVAVEGFVAKYNSGGVFLWSKIFTSGVGNFHYFSSVKFDASNNIYASGMGAAVFFSKLTSSGTVLWTIDNPSVSTYIYYSIVGEFDIDNYGDIYIAGIQIISDSVGFDPSNNDFILSKYDTNGNLIWIKTDTAGGVDDNDFYLPSNAVICNGNFIYVADPLSIDAPLCPVASPSQKIILSKYDLSGNLITKNQYMYPGSVYNFPLKMNFNGTDFFIGGISTTDPSLSIDSYLIVKADTNCNFIWGKVWAGGDQNEISDIVSDNSGNVFVTGASYFSTGMQNIATNAYDGLGNLLWAIPYNPSVITSSGKLSVSINGIYVSGNEVFTGSNNANFLTLKYNYIAGTYEYSNAQSLAIYPNPNDGVFGIASSPNSVIKFISLFDISGKELRKINIENESASIDVSDIENGCYFFVANFSDGSTKSGKFIKAK